jgi:hypothetical protein
MLTVGPLKIQIWSREEENIKMTKVVFTAIALFFLFGCASLPPAQPIKDLGSIAGTWKEKSGGTMDINGDGTYRFRIGDSDTRGTMSVQDGKAITSRGKKHPAKFKSARQCARMD